MVIFFLFYFIFYLLCSCFFVFLLGLLVALNGIKKYLACHDKINRNGGLPTNLMVNTPPNHNNQKTIACNK